MAHVDEHEVGPSRPQPRGPITTITRPSGPHESPWRITAPLVILATCAMFVGYLNASASPFKTEKFTEWVEPRGVPVSDAEATAALSGETDISVTTPGRHRRASERGSPARPRRASTPRPVAGSTSLLTPSASRPRCPTPSSSGRRRCRRSCWWRSAASSACGSASASSAATGSRSKGLTTRFAPARWGYNFLVNKYYLDHLYEKVIVHGIAHPIAQGAYWINQHVLDGIVNGVGKGGRRSGAWVYRNIDQRVVDGAVNGSGVMASESGHALQPVQSGKVNQYGALLFGAAAVAAIVLVILNV